MTAFKIFKIFLKAVFLKFYLVYSWILRPKHHEQHRTISIHYSFINRQIIIFWDIWMLASEYKTIAYAITLNSEYIKHAWDAWQGKHIRLNTRRTKSYWKYHQNAPLSLKFKSRYMSNNYMTYKIVLSPLLRKTTESKEKIL